MGDGVLTEGTGHTRALGAQGLVAADGAGETGLVAAVDVNILLLLAWGAVQLRRDGRGDHL